MLSTHFTLPPSPQCPFAALGVTKISRKKEEGTGSHFYIWSIYPNLTHWDRLTWHRTLCACSIPVTPPSKHPPTHLALPFAVPTSDISQGCSTAPRPLGSTGCSVRSTGSAPGTALLPPCWGITADLQVCNGREKVRRTRNVPPQPVSRAGQWMGGGRTVFREVSGEQRAWRRTGVLSVIKGKRTDLTLLGGWQDEPKHPQLLLLPCWERSSLGEPGTQLPPIWEWPPQL